LTLPNHRAGITGLALADNPLQGTRSVTAAGGIPYPSYEARVVGNVVYNPHTGTQEYRAALIVPATQQGFNSQSGIINYIDYLHGRFRVGGIIGNPLSGTLCEINDPITAPDGAGRFGLRHSPDPRFTADTTNPTITTATGYPCGLPRVAPSATPQPPIALFPITGFSIPAAEVGDPTRPYTQRPKNNATSGFPIDPFLPADSMLKTFTMPALAAVVPGGPDPTLQVPMMVGDYVTFSGTLFKINPIGPNTAANMFISVHTLELDLGVYTALGDRPVYVKCDVALIGTDGNTNATLGNPSDPFVNVGVPSVGTVPGEFARRATFEGFCTDAGTPIAPKNAFGTATVTAYGVNDTTGVLEQVPNDAAGGPRGNPTSVEIIPLGRYVFRSSQLDGVPATTPPPAIPLTREYRVKHSNGIFGGEATPTLVCNGLIAGQFQLPMFDFVTPEHTVMGAPQYPGNYFDLPFLSTLDPFPGTPGGNQPLP